ncbi:MAG TPA: chromosome segregation protein SMC [Firmicutes bacterium]|jgi:hypothetical protein|nr:hypothetical protein [Gelria sp. Kuro-4]MDI3522074.1 hypothetical protein [Bacillota bacterium]MDK2927890.1 hypothetical protein [Bacillota bacterium]BCV23739.1 hypothetical protein kuro4_05120 [Gelria sp. Kuro-4]HHV57790.1 chromosome segregation protein SMC [Bacillota bacterium]
MKRRLEALVKERDQLLDEWANDKDSRLKLLVRIMDLEDEIAAEKSA